MTILLESDALLADALSPATSCSVVVPDLVAVRRELAADPTHDLVVIGPDTEMDAIADFAAEERLVRPWLGVVVVRRRVDTSTLREAMKAGIREVVTLDDLTGITAACRASIEVSTRLRGDAPTGGAAGHLGHLVTVFSAKGGCGKTTMATNLAAAWARAGRRVCLVDLDLAFGDVGIALQMFPERGLADLPPLAGRLDPSAAASLVTQHSSGVHAVLAPTEPGTAELITSQAVGELLQALKTMYDVVVVDTPPAFTDQVLTAFDTSDHLALVTTLDVPALKNLKLTLETLDILGYSRERWNVVLNRADAKVGLTVADVEQTLRTTIAVQVPSSRDVPASINRGVPIVLDAPGHPVSAAIRRFADHLVGDGGHRRSGSVRRGLGFRRRTQGAPA